MSKVDHNDMKESLFLFYSENKLSVRHHETERSTVASAFIAISAALIGLITFDEQITASDIPTTLFLTLLGIYGAIFSAKQWERSALHNRRASLFRQCISEQLSDNLVLSIREQADREHKKEFKLLLNVKLHTFWITLYCIIAFLGVFLTFIAACHPVVS